MSIRYPFFFLSISILLSVFTYLHHPVIIVFLLLFYSYIGQKFDCRTVITIIVCTLVFMAFMQLPKTFEEEAISGEIVNVDEKSITIKTDQTRVRVFGEIDEMTMGDEVELQVTYFPIPEVTNDHSFNYEYYLYSLGISEQAYLQKVISHTVHDTVFEWLQNRIEGETEVHQYASLLLLGVKNNEIEETYNQMIDISIVHLFALSGMHIQVMKRWLEMILKYIITGTWLKYLVLGIIGIYVYVLPYNISFVRAYGVMVIYMLFKSHISQLDALGIMVLISIFFRPYVIFNMSFIFSYGMYFVMLLLGNNAKAKYAIYLASIPLILLMQYRIHALSFILGVILMPFVEWLYMAMLWFLVLGDIVLPGIQFLLFFFSNILEFVNGLSWYIPFQNPSLFFMLSYYYLYGRMVIKINQGRKCFQEVCMLLSVLVMFYAKPYYTFIGQVVMIDVGQGDCFLIQQPFNKGSILIDTGGLKKQDVATTSVVPYLRSQGIHSLDYVFISHDDFDHNGAYESLKEQISIRHTIDYYVENITIGDIEITMYQIDAKTRDINANSLVFKVDVFGIQYLFTGDIGIEEEKKLYEKYGFIDVDVLKVAHHGSKTSTGTDLFSLIQPKVALISCGKNNSYGHPHQEVIDRLERQGVHIYRTDTNGMVRIVYYGKENYIFQ